MTVGRVQWIDAAKGIGIALIVIGHVWSMTKPSLAYQIIYGFHVPLFFLLAGLTFNPDRESTTGALARKARTLLIPYLCFGLLGYCVYAAGYLLAETAGLRLQGFSYGLLQPLLGLAYGSLGDGRLANSPIWFLTGLFSAFVMIRLIHAGLHRPVFRVLAIGAIFLLGLWIGPRWTLPWSMAPAMLALPFMAAGMTLRQTNPLSRLDGRARIAALLATAAITAAAPLNGHMQLGHGLVGNPVLYLVFATAGSATVLLFSQLPLALNRSFATIGRHSLEILVWHMLIIKAVQVVLAVATGLDMAALTETFLPGLGVLCLTALLTIAASVITRRWIPWTLGGKG